MERPLGRQIFSEDLEMLKRQQANLPCCPERRQRKLNINAGGMHSRRAIERAIAAEAIPPDRQHRVAA